MAYATTDTTATDALADLLVGMADESGAAVDVEAAEERGWMVPDGECLVVTDEESGRTWLLTVQEVSR